MSPGRLSEWLAFCSVWWPSVSESQRAEDGVRTACSVLFGACLYQKVREERMLFERLAFCSVLMAVCVRGSENRESCLNGLCSVWWCSVSEGQRTERGV